MSILIKNQNDDTLINDRDDYLRLVEQGQLSNDGTVTEGGLYFYSVTVPLFGSNDPFILAVKSDFDRIVPLPPEDGNNSQTISFYSSSSGPKDYKYFSKFSFGSFTTETGQGIQVFKEDGSLSYDSRIPEAKHIDSLVIVTPSSNTVNFTQNITHNEASPAWYSVNTFPHNFSFFPDSPSFRVVILRSFQQISSTETEINATGIEQTKAPQQLQEPVDGVMFIVDSI